MSTRLEPNVRRSQILSAAVAVATDQETLRITRLQVANQAQVSEALVSKYFNTMHQLRRALVRHAAVSGDIPVLALANMSSDYKVDIPENLKEYVADHIRKKIGA